jgi:hypothetical protein
METRNEHTGELAIDLANTLVRAAARSGALGDAAAVAAVDQVRDAVEQAGPGRGVEGAVTGVGEKDRDIAGRRVRRLPLVAAERRRTEPT